MDQLPLFPAPALPSDDFVRGLQVDRTGAARYVHLIRAPDDPERSPRPIGGRQDRAPHLTLAKASLATCVKLLLGLLADGIPRTFNRMAVELFDDTADIVFGSPFDDALWHLVDDDRIEHTMTAPIRFRLAASEP